MKTVAIGLLGTVLDVGQQATRWERWRPSVSLCQHEDLRVDRFELLCQARYLASASRVADDMRSVSPETEVNLVTVEFNDPWDFEQVYAALHDFTRNYTFDPAHEDYLVHITTGTHVAQICLFLLTESRVLPARLVQTSPPPKRGRARPGGYQIIDLDLSRYDRIARRFEQVQQEGLSFLKSGIDTRNGAFNALIERIERVAIASRSPILLTGPTGAGKSQLARRIYELKRARHAIEGAFVEVNCATLRGDAAMSALFGHEKGAFTGALEARPGLLRTADGGMLFLDEIGELGADEQAMLLRAIEEKRFLPVGADTEVASDFQLIAGTNRDLAAEVAAGGFREDLLARIDLWTFPLPGLCERPEDLAPNLDYELDRFAETHGTRATFNREARDTFLAFATDPATEWKANFRDLNAAVTRMATLAPGGRIRAGEVSEEVARLRAGWRADAPISGDDGLERLLGPERAAALDLFDRVQLAEVVRVCRSSVSLSDAGRRLFAASRQKKSNPNDADRLRKYLARFELTWSAAREK